MTYEVSDAVPDGFLGRAFNVNTFLEITDPRQPDAQVLLAVRNGGKARTWTTSTV